MLDLATALDRTLSWLRHHSDGRAALAAITADGKAFISDRRAERSLVLARQLHALPGDDQATLLAALPALERLTAQPASR